MISVMYDATGPQICSKVAVINRVTTAVHINAHALE